MHYYRMSLDEVKAQLKTKEDGLSSHEATKRLREYGENYIEEHKARSLWRIFFQQFTSPLIIILLLASAVTLAFREYKDSLVIFIAVFSNAVIGFFQEFNAERSMRALSDMLVPQAIVVRDGLEMEIPATKLVPGDVVLLQSGVRVPADVRIFEAVDALVDESALTGESVPASKEPHALAREHLTPGDQKNMAFMGTMMVRGRIMGMVTTTGYETVLGDIARQVDEVHTAETPLQMKMQKFANFITKIVMSGVLTIFVVGAIRGLSLHDLFLSGVAVAVAAIPEGLPIVVTVAMAIGVQRMARKSTIIRTLPSVETLGSTTVICTDKTGTLTKNEMTVQKLYDGVNVYDVDGDGYGSKGKILHKGKVLKQPHDGLLKVLHIGAVCNESQVIKKNGEFEFTGDPTEAALIVSAEKASMKHEHLLHRFKQIAIMPFESGRNYMATLNDEEGHRYIFVKGAPEALTKLCKKAEHATPKEHLMVAEEFARSGLRVLAMAYKKVPATQDTLDEADLKSGLVLCGMQAMMDPPRPEVIKAVKGCQEAGIRVVMITGDHAITARAIGEMIGICGPKSPVLTGVQLDELTPKQLMNRVKDVSVFARVSPENKLQIVNALMKRGEIVAVTGDGVNDAPMLKAAHLGIAMGRDGTDVARESANMILKNDNFASIFQAVYEGRVVFENIRKAVVFLIPTGIASIFTFLVTIAAGLPPAFLPVQLLWINLVASGIQDVALAFEPGDRHVLRQKPRPPQEGIMSQLLLQRTVLVAFVITAGVLFVYFYALERGYTIEMARTLAVTTMVFFQFFQVWNSRSEVESVFHMNPFTNPMLFFGLTGSFVAHLLVLYIPSLEWLFELRPLSAYQWVMILSIASTVFIVVELDKLLRRKLHAHYDKKRAALALAPRVRRVRR